jgi:hypothetical protein
MSTARLCKDCKYLPASKDYEMRQYVTCQHPAAIKTEHVDLVYGESGVHRMYPRDMRLSIGSCGLDGKLFEPRQEGTLA